MGISPSLDLDPNFADFNFCTIVDPALIPGQGPSSSLLYEIVFRARKGERHSANEFADTIYWTLKEGSFEAFKWKHGPRPIAYEDWFYTKLLQFGEILLHEELLIDCMHPPETDKPWEEGLLTGSGPVRAEAPAGIRGRGCRVLRLVESRPACFESRVKAPESFRIYC